ncbi:DinB family protein [Haloactinomyces albus]|uniref:Damage-inducible protein DinB n=1 Tax=Haloactinomyces albus TaxID=1352928 RepID=A0AAE3ZFU2_9ACTN|nr:DinB family protein [Haloactinomyces albus]MDR7302798.1 putative damage-inducible protein DinB [Haloactinomyces albus]
MPFMVRPVTDERDGLLAFLEKQRNALRAAVHGLTEEQAVRTSTASALSLAALLKHAARTERRWVVVLIAQRALPELWPMRDPDADFRIDPGETSASLLDTYAAVTEETESIVHEVTDLGTPLPLPADAPPVPGSENWSARWVLLHLIEETARHAGHADIIRESLDGASAFSLMQATEEALSETG